METIDIETLLAMEFDRVNGNDYLSYPDGTSMFEVDSLLNFNHIHAHDQDTATGHLDLEKVDVDIEFCLEMNPGVSECMDTVVEETCHVKENIQEEFMEESGLTDVLLTAAEAIEAEDWLLAFIVVESLNSRLIDRENGENSFMKLVFFFTQGLHYKSFKAPELSPITPIQKPTDTMSVFQMLQELTPYLKFAHFAANQAILETTKGDPEVHVIDFDVLEGIQWPPLMIDLVSRKGVSLRITAVVGDPTSMGYIRQTGRRLKEFAGSIYLPFRNFASVNCFLNGVRKLSPKMIILTEEEILNLAKIPSMSFVDFFCKAFHHYTALYESLVTSCRGYKVGLKLIEKVIELRILDSLKQFPFGSSDKKSWEGGFSALKGYKAIPMSYHNVSQAKYLVGIFSGGYWVQHEKCKLGLCWKSRPLISTIIWVPL
ncbi:nodulation-signaling pathway 2 protein-like [Papaver somniferum]|uniref:nodulation-signaling pathway 2 protein-like n=1 Tax=Papaver somniferum TaxID=3469 RepID=UPI000E6F7BDC|nr:nodulation-signaling pathway 2 protein-like [Papaver somniferum]